MTKDELPPPPPSPLEPDDEISSEAVSPDEGTGSEIRPEPPIYAMLRKAWLAGGVGVVAGLLISTAIAVWGYGHLAIDPLHVPGAAADVLGAAFGGQFTQTVATANTPSLLHLHVQGSVWLAALVVALAIAIVARICHRDDSDSDSARLWGQAGLAGAALAILVALVTLLPSTIADGADGETIKTGVSLLPTVVTAFFVGTTGYALGIIRLKRYGGVERLGLRLPSWIRIPAFAVALHVVIVVIASTVVTVAYALTTSFADHSPATAIRLDGVNSLIALTGLGGWGYADQDAPFSQLPDIGTAVTPVTGHPIWMMAITLITAVIAFFVAAITLHLRRPLGRGQWNGIGITLGLYAIAGLILIMVASTHGFVEDHRDVGPSIQGDQAFVHASWWSLTTVLVIGLGVECASRFIAPKVLSLMPGIVRRYGKVPGPDVNP